MEQLFFVGIIVLFSILEAVARKGRAGQGGGEGIPLPEEPEARVPRPRPRPRAESGSPAGTVPRSYDEDPSFDEAAQGDEGRMRPAPAAERAEPLGEGSTTPRTSSEGLIPAEVWDDIQRMARGEQPKGPTAPVPQRPMPRPQGSRPPQGRPPQTRPAESRSPVLERPRPPAKAKPSQRAGAPTAQPRTGRASVGALGKVVETPPLMEGTADHPVHLSHAAYGTAPSSRVGIPLEGARRPPSVAAEVRKLLAPNRNSLRQAVILQEILGPPPGLRED